MLTLGLSNIYNMQLKMLSKLGWKITVEIGAWVDLVSSYSM